MNRTQEGGDKLKSAIETATAILTSDYSKHDHSHCWSSKNPPCGQKIKHFECCLCKALHPDITPQTKETESNFLEVDIEERKKILRKHEETESVDAIVEDTLSDIVAYILGTSNWEANLDPIREKLTSLQAQNQAKIDEARTKGRHIGYAEVLVMIEMIEQHPELTKERVLEMLTQNFTLTPSDTYEHQTK